MDISRRTLLATGLGVTAAGTLAACGQVTDGLFGAGTHAGHNMDGTLLTDDLMKRIEAREAQRYGSGRTVKFKLSPQLASGSIGGGTKFTTKLYNGQLTGPLLRASVGDLMEITLDNQLDEPTTLHTHGLALRNDMDGVSGVTQGKVAAGASFVHSFKSPHAGTYWYHSHTGFQPEEGMYGPLVIDDPKEITPDYDTEWIILIDDWTVGIGPTPQQQLDALIKAGGGTTASSDGMGGMGMGNMNGMGGMNHSHMAGEDTFGLGHSDVPYNAYLVNGRRPEDPTVFTAKPGERIRLRVINAGSDTAFQFALQDHELTLTHTDGFPVVPFTTDSVVIGMGERYDAIVTAGSGVFGFVAQPIGKTGNPAMALLKTASGSAPKAGFKPAEFGKRVAQARDLQAHASVELTGTPEATASAMLMGSMAPYQWSINGTTDMFASPLIIPDGKTARVTFMNHSMMYHPMHLHGHTFQVRSIDGQQVASGARKDTVLVKPMTTVTVDVLADNPGNWALHCHNLYHMERGMMTVVKYAFS